jgi:23S rRNA pseudouridine2605 synthase
MDKRLNKALAEAGIGARRKVENLIFGGVVTVNGKVCILPQHRIDPTRDIVCVRGKPIGYPDKVYFILNKPTGFACTHKRIGKRAILYDLFDPSCGRIFSVGRLDKDTSGLLIVTNDGDFSQKVIHPSSGVEKEYVAKTNQEIMPKDLAKLMQGTTVMGVHVKPVSVRKVRKGTVKIVVMEGKKHEVREMMASANLKVQELKRVRIGQLRLGTIPLGQFRELSDSEKELIFS